MRHIQVKEALRIRFPDQPATFDEGVEVGMAVILMAEGLPQFSRWISRGARTRLEALADHFHYRLQELRADAEGVEIVFRQASVRPALRIV